jgi:hypothetical protein
MTPKKSDLASNTKQVLVYVKEDRLELLDKKCEGRSRNKVLRKLIDGFIEGKFEIDWRE